MVVASQLALGSKRCEFYRFELQKQNQLHHSQHPKVPPVPGTSILAFSDARRYGTVQDDRFVKLKIATESGRTLLSDRKGWFDHLTTPEFAQICKLLRPIISDCDPSSIITLRPISMSFDYSSPGGVTKLAVSCLTLVFPRFI